MAIPKGESYFGRVIATFDLKEIPARSLALDFRGVKISHLKVNDQDVQNEAGENQTTFVEHEVNLPVQHLRVGANVVSMNIFNKYRKDGVGLHSFTDAVDQEQYLYTQFEADFCHYVFPVFDQPDLKATWTFKAVVPEDWTVIANEYVDPERESQEHQDELKNQLAGIASFFGVDETWAGTTSPKCFWFKESARISTYIYAIVAGPYDYFESIQEDLPPMRIYARKSLKEDINHKEMFLVTQVGMRFYKDLFGKEYPFAKYDQVFVPEHNYGAMENVGCVTYNEAYMFRG